MANSWIMLPAIDGFAHAESPLGCDFTLCGLGRDHSENGAEVEEVTGEGTIDCPTCLQIIKFCRGLIEPEGPREQ